MMQNTNIEVDQKGVEYYKQIVDLANVAIVKFDKDLILTDFIGNSEVIFGFKKEEVVGKHLNETIVPDIESTGRNLGELIKGLIDDTKSYEYNINENIRKNGERIWVQWYNNEIKDENGELAGILSIGIDITDRINTEIALKESEERFKTLSNLTMEGILLHEDGFIIDCNLSLERQIGYSREELIGHHIFDSIVPKKYHKQMLGLFEKSYVQYEAEAQHKSGKLIPVSIESRNIRVGDKVLRVAAIRDVSELKKTIDELDRYKNHLEDIVHKRTQKLKQQSKELKKQNDILELERNQLRAIIDHIPDLIYIKDRKHCFLNSNISHIRHLGQTELNDILGKTDLDFYNKKYSQNYFNDEVGIFKTGMPIVDREELSIDKTGKQIFLLTTKVPIKDHKGHLINIVGIGRDITEKKNSEEKLKLQTENLKEANKHLQESKEELETTLEQLKNAQMHLIQSEKMASLGVLLAGIAHEINNPVNFVYAGVNSIVKDFEDIKTVIEKIIELKGDEDDYEKIRDIIALKNENEFEVAYEAIIETLKDIKLGANRISEIIAGLNRFSRLENEKWKKTNLHEEINSVLILLKNKYKHHIEIIKNYDDKLPLTECYPGKLNQVLMNIINNAIDAIEGNKGTIKISTGFDDNNVQISITDNGKGIAKEDQHKIFDPFYTTKEVGMGMGLGLAISYSIIKEHNGEIMVHSSLNKGTEFIIKMPILQNQ